MDQLIVIPPLVLYVTQLKVHMYVHTHPKFALVVGYKMTKFVVVEKWIVSVATDFTAITISVGILLCQIPLIIILW